MTSRRHLLTAAGLCGVALAGAAPAQAESIAYVKDGDVFLTTPDASRTFQVTRTGDYAYVSQADDGTMIALAPGERLRKLSRTGQVLADFPTMVSDGPTVSGPVYKFAGPFEPQISPDGSKVAFEWFNDSYEETPGCSAGSSPPCAVYSQRQGVAISWSDRLTGPEEFPLMTGWIYPQWIGEGTLVRSSSGRVLNDDAVLTKVEPGAQDDEVDGWMYDPQGGGSVSDVELSRDLTTAVGIGNGTTADELNVYRTLSDPFDTPDWNHSPFAQGNVPAVERCDQITGTTFRTPSLSPDGRGLAFGSNAGIGVIAMPDLSNGCAPLDASAAKLIVPGGTHPDWGPADVPTGSSPGPTPNPPVNPGPGPVGPQDGGLTVRRAKLRKALKRGLLITVPDNGPQQVSARYRKRVVARGAGSGTVRLRFTKAGRRALRGKRSAKLVVTAGSLRTTVTLTR